MVGSNKTTRRQFLKFVPAASVGLSLGNSASVDASFVKYGKFHDTTKCIGCKRCVSACKRWNKLKIDREEELTDRETDLSGQTWVVVNLTRDKRNREDLHYLHWGCQHCIKPACAGACPVKAISKLPEGPVIVNENKCIGCRYCMAACPYYGRRFNWNEPYVPAAEMTKKQHYLGNRMRAKGQMEKCTFCVQRSREGRLPACVEACPTGARVFGNLLDPKSEIRFVLKHKKVFRFKEDLGTDPKYWYFID